MGLKIVEVPEGGGTVKIITNTPPSSDGAAGSPKPAAPAVSGKPMFGHGLKVFVICILIGIVFLIAASLVGQYNRKSKPVTAAVASPVTAVNKTVQNVDMKVNKQAQEGQKSGYYYGGEKGIIYDFPTAQTN